MGQRFPVITQAWLNAWEHVIPFLAFPAEVRRIVYTTDESVKGFRVESRSFSSDGSVAVRWQEDRRSPHSASISGWVAILG